MTYDQWVMSHNPFLPLTEKERQNCWDTHVQEKLGYNLTEELTLETLKELLLFLSSRQHRTKEEWEVWDTGLIKRRKSLLPIVGEIIKLRDQQIPQKEMGIFYDKDKELNQVMHEVADSTGFADEDIWSENFNYDVRQSEENPNNYILTIHTDPDSPNEIADEISELLKEKGFDVVVRYDTDEDEAEVEI